MALYYPYEAESTERMDWVKARHAGLEPSSLPSARELRAAHRAREERMSRRRQRREDASARREGRFTVIGDPYGRGFLLVGGPVGEQANGRQVLATPAVVAVIPTATAQQAGLPSQFHQPVSSLPFPQQTWTYNVPPGSAPGAGGGAGGGIGGSAGGGAGGGIGGSAGGITGGAARRRNLRGLRIAGNVGRGLPRITPAQGKIVRRVAGNAARSIVRTSNGRQKAYLGMLAILLFLVVALIVVKVPGFGGVQTRLSLAKQAITGGARLA